MTREFIPLSIPNLAGRELEYVTNAINTGWVSTGGPYVSEFEKRIADYVHVEGAVSCQNGTSGLHIALLVSGVKENDEVIVPALTFIAAVNPVKYIGAEPVFMDCDDSLAIDPHKLREFCSIQCTFTDNGVLVNKTTGKAVKAIVVVHIFGNMADMEQIMEIAVDYNLTVIEDATEAIGTYYTSGRYIGRYAGTIGVMGVYSFNGNKIMTTGGGGMIVSNNKDFLKRAKHLTTQAKSDDLYYTHDEIGFNYRMTNLQAALGMAQLEQLESFIRKKEQNYLLYKSELDPISGLEILPFREGTRSNYWFYSLLCGDKYPLNREQLIAHLSSQNIQSRPVWGLIPDQKPYQSSMAYKIDKALYYVKHIVNIPCSTNLSEADLLYVIECLKQPD